MNQAQSCWHNMRNQIKQLGKQNPPLWCRINAASVTIREEIKQEFIRKVSDLVARINEIAAVVRQGANKDVIVVIDDLDKLDLGVVRQLYQ